MVRSSSLDAALHPDGVVNVGFGSRKAAAGGAGAGCVLESFQLDSVAEYLRAQAGVREALEGELAAAWEDVPAGRRGKAGGLWRHVEVRGVSIYRRNVPGPELLAAIERREGKRAAEASAAAAAKADTRSAFLVYVELAGQDYLAVFRDGALASFELL